MSSFNVPLVPEFAELFGPQLAEIRKQQSAYQFKDVAPQFPSELKSLNRWIVRTADKRPYSAFQGDENNGPIDPHDEQYQADYETALGALEETAKFSGLGFVFNYADGLTGVDFDDCVNPETLEIRPDVLAIVQEVGSYTEFSPSRSGLHIFVKGWQFPIGPQGQQGANVGKAEMYSSKRYFTVTGNHVPGTPLTVNSRNLDWLYERIVKNREFGKKKETASAAETATSSCKVTRKTKLITSHYETLTKGTIIRSKENGSTDFAIEDENQILEYDSQSEADYALLGLITDKLEDMEAIKAEFLESPLGQRDKATSGDYLDRSIKKLLASPPRDTTEDGDGISIDRPKLLTEVGNARRLIETHGKNLHYCHDEDVWYVYKGKIWVIDRSAVHIQDLMKQMLIRLQAETGESLAKINVSHLLSKITKKEYIPKKDSGLTGEDEAVLKEYKMIRDLHDFASASETSQKIHGAVEQARSEPGVGITKSQFDSNPMLCNLENGTLVFDMNGNVTSRKHLREDLLTRNIPVKYDPDARCPQFEAFIEWMFPDKEVRDYVLTHLSLSLIGIVVRIVLILYGEGANGKSTLAKVMNSFFGTDKNQYGISVAFSTFSVGREESAGGARSDLVKLNGPRFITASESNKKRVVLDMARLKELTGGDLTTARGCYAREDQSFYAQGKIMLMTNQLPTISDDSEAAWERLKLIECLSRITESGRDLDLAAKLGAEASGILNLLIRHLQAFLQKGVQEPASVKTATEAYRGAENAINRFVMEHCELRGSFSIPSSEFYSRYKMWCQNSGEQPESQKAVTQYLERRLKVKGRHMEEGNVLFGIRLRSVMETKGDVVFNR